MKRKIPGNQKDIGEKKLLNFVDVFVDVMNVILYKGERIIQENDIEQVLVRESYPDNEVLKERERDILKLWKQTIYLGIENQTDINSKMVYRILLYDGISYQSQKAVITIVLYYGKERWVKHKSILEEIEEGFPLKEEINDYKIKVIEVAFLEREVIDQFTSDFWVICDYFEQVRRMNTYIPTSRILKHPKETITLLSKLTDDQSYMEAYNELSKKGMVNTMCEVVDYYLNKGREEGREESKAEFLLQGEINILSSLIKQGFISITVAAAQINLSEEEFIQKQKEYEKQIY